MPGEAQFCRVGSVFDWLLFDVFVGFFQIRRHDLMRGFSIFTFFEYLVSSEDDIHNRLNLEKSPGHLNFLKSPLS